MSILIDKVRIAGFRGISNLEISLQRVVVLIGQNNAGKTSLIKAIQLAMGDYSRYLSEEDFYINSSGDKASSILVDVRIVATDDAGNRVNMFSTDWMILFGDRIKSEPNGMQYLALRTKATENFVKGGFDVARSTLESWPLIDNWTTAIIKETKLNTRISSVPFISIEAQRDVYQELKEKSSFVGKVLSSIEYQRSDIVALEELIKEVNDAAVDKSASLQSLKTHLNKLNHAVGGAGGAEVTPFPKKLRDLSKHFSVHFGEGANTSFSMEYHGMGTRSWASMLTVKSFIDLQVEKHREESEPFFPIIAAEEPEAHLHPNAQRTIYHQLAQTRGQVILSTHSPYLAAMAEPNELRSLTKRNGAVIVGGLDSAIDSESLRRLRREVIHSRGEIFFSKAIVLCEGETEEQALPLLFRKYFENESFQLGVNFVSVSGSGKKYLPFFRFAQNFSIPVFVFSDGEEKTRKELKKNFELVFGTTDIDNSAHITILDDTDFEGYLVKEGYRNVLEDAIKEVEGAEAIDYWIRTRNGTPSSPVKTSQPPCTSCNQSIYESPIRDYSLEAGELRALHDILDSKKTAFAPVIADKLCELEKNNFPAKLIELFEKIKNGALL